MAKEITGLFAKTTMMVNIILEDESIPETECRITHRGVVRIDQLFVKGKIVLYTDEGKEIEYRVEDICDLDFCEDTDENYAEEQKRTQQWINDQLVEMLLKGDPEMP